MRLWLDEYAHLDSPLHRWEPRCKLVALLALIFAFAFVNTLYLAPPVLAIACLLCAVSRLPLSFLLSRLRYPGFFLLAVVVMVPFINGRTILFASGPFALRQEGLLLSLLIITRFVAILTVSLVLFGTSPFLTTLAAMRDLGLPSLLVDMMLFFYRYLQETADNLAALQRAMHLRGFQGNRLHLRNLQMMAALVGSLLIRSYEQSERIYHAMLLRGYGQALQRQQPAQASRYDTSLLYGMLGVAAGLIAANVVLSS